MRGWLGACLGTVSVGWKPAVSCKVQTKAVPRALRRRRLMILVVASHSKPSGQRWEAGKVMTSAMLAHALSGQDPGLSPALSFLHPPASHR